MLATPIAPTDRKLAHSGRISAFSLARAQPYFYMAPALIILAIFVYWPILASLFLSFHRWDFLRPTIPFVGLANYEELLSSPEFWNSLRVTCIFVIASVPVRLILALFLAHYQIQETGLHRVVRGVVFAPVITSAVSIAIVWSWLFNTDIGLINGVLVSLGLDRVP
ncbi:MAG: sugar ABC transporter permease [Pseudomonadota bacterium]